jgi:serine/threonine-protein kinase
MRRSISAAGYRDVRLLGEGAHGFVFEATKDGRAVAVKVASDLEYALYLTEENQFLVHVGAYVAKTRSGDAPRYFPQAKLVSVPATDRQRETTVMEMERVARSASDASSSDSLARKLKRGPVDEALGRSLLVHLPRALEQLHDAGIVHRDLKPANILVTDTNLPVIVDFGIAAYTGGQPDPLGHGPGMTSGTMAYMGPEQALGAQASPRMDVFAARSCSSKRSWARIARDVTRSRCKPTRTRRNKRTSRKPISGFGPRKTSSVASRSC